MTPRIPENISTWLVDWRLVTIVENVPPRDPNDDDEDEEEKRTRTGTKSQQNRTLADWPALRPRGVLVVKQANEAIEHHEVEIGALLSRREREYERAH
jgi:hypothetical protein